MPPNKRKGSENTRAGRKAKKPRINQSGRNGTMMNPANSSHEDHSNQAIPPAVSSGEEEEFKGQPPIWAEDRTELCNTLDWFRSHQSGSYTIDKKCYGFLLDGHGGGPRDYIDDEIVITRAGGDCKLDANGNLKQQKNQDETTRAVESLRASKDSGFAVGLIIGNKNGTIWREVPHRYNVMGWFRVVDVWFEKTDNDKFGARVRFQKLNLQEPSWWARKGTEDPQSLSERKLIEPQRETCRKCGKSSMLMYEQGWMCLQVNCEASWKLKNGGKPTNLTYAATFLSSRELPNDKIKPPLSLIPDRLTAMANPDVRTSRDAWRGVVCPRCNRCVSRTRWNSWICSDSLDSNTGHQATCQWEEKMEMTAIPIQSVLESTDTKKSRRNEGELMQPNNIRSTDSYEIVTYVIDGVGKIFHFSAKDSTLQRPNGPNELFRRLQEADLGLRRYRLRVKSGNKQLTSHFAANFGMPYKYVVPVHSKAFTEAPAEIMFALGRLTWATKNAVVEKVSRLNEMLTVGYFEQMSMGYHDDGEDSLGPTIASLSLGAKATMKFRLKDQYFRGSGPTSKVPVPDDAVLPGCDDFEKRKQLKEQHDSKQLNDAEYTKQRMELAGTFKEKESKPLISLDLHHGDMVVMDGALLQKYYEHSVTSGGKLRFALTARHVLEDGLMAEELAKGQYVLVGDQIYDGK